MLILMMMMMMMLILTLNMKIDPGADCWRNIIADEEDDKVDDDIMI